MDLDLLKQAVQLYRENNPTSRAQNVWTYYGSSGVVRRATCIFCRRLIATCSNNWPETKRFRENADDHAFDCARKYLTKNAQSN